jgi:hypothetical protein
MENQTTIENRGGYREGAGRPKGARDSGPRMTRTRLNEWIARMESLGVLQGTARRVLASIGGDSYWLELFDKLEQDGNHDKIAQLMQFLLQMRDGRPAQQITVTSIGVQFSSEEIARARGVVRELIKPQQLLPQSSNPPGSDVRPSVVADAAEITIASSEQPRDEGETKAKHASEGARG